MVKVHAPFQRDHARQLIKAGESQRAVAYMMRLATGGDIAAMIGLADYEYDQGNRQRSLEWINRAEETLRPGDVDSKIDLVSAYQRGLGPDDHSCREARAIQLLGEVAETGNVVAAHTLMSYYLHGLNGAEVSREKFEYWARVAASAGSEGAAAALRRMDDWPNVEPDSKRGG